MVEILLAVYNGAEYLRQQLESIGCQSYENWRLIIRDDCSSDESMTIAKDFQKKYPDGKVVIYINDTATGSAKNNFFKLTQDADCDYVMFCDQDDVWHSRKIEYTLQAMKNEEKQDKNLPVLIHSDLYVVDEHLNMIAKSMRKYQNLPKSTKVNTLIVQNSVTGCTVMINRVLLNEIKKAKNTDHIVMHDYWAALIAQVFGKTAYIEKPLIKYRQHGDNSVGASKANSLGYLLKRFKAGRGEFKSNMDMSMKQIEYFCQVYAEELRNNLWRDQLLEYSQLYKSTKLRKVIYYFQYSSFKCGIIRKIMQMIWS